MQQHKFYFVEYIAVRSKIQNTMKISFFTRRDFIKTYHYSNSRAMSPSSTCMAVEPAFRDEKFKELVTDKESLKLQVRSN